MTLPAPRQLTRFTAVCLTFSVIALALTRKASGLWVLALVAGMRMGSDSSRFMNRAWTIVSSGQPLYPTLFFGQHIKFIYPTSSLLLYWFAHAVHLSGTLFIKPIVLLSLLGTLYLIGEVYVHKASEFSPLTPRERRNSRLMIALLGVLFFPLVSGVYIGQIQTLLTFLWTFVVWLWITNRKSLAGVTLALICVFKPTLVVFFLWAALRKEWRFLSWFSATLVLIQAVSIALFGWRNEVDYLAVLRFLSHHGEAFAPNQTINGLLQRFTHNGVASRWSETVYPPYNRLVYLGTMISSVLLFVIGLATPVLARWKDRAFDLMFFGMISTLASPIGWEHHYGYFLVPCIYLLARMIGQGRPIPIAFSACFIVLSTSWDFLIPFADGRFGFLLDFSLVSGVGILVLSSAEMLRAQALPPDGLKQHLLKRYSRAGIKRSSLAVTT